MHPPASQPRFQVSHLLLWIFGAATILSMARWATPQPNQFPEELRDLAKTSIAPSLYIHAVLKALIFGPAVASCFLFLWRLFRPSAPFPVEPGHWLLLLSGTLVGTGFLTHFTLGMHTVKFEAPNYDFFANVEQLTGAALACILFSLPVFLLKSEQRWTVLFGLFSALAATSCLVRLSRVGMSLGIWPASVQLKPHLIHFIPVVNLPAILVVVGLDIQHNVNRDWLHWVGIVVYLAGTTLYTIMLLFSS